MRALFIHAQKIAPPQLCPPLVEHAEEQSLPTEELTCPICVNIVERPIQLTSCSSIVCCQCLSQWLNITDDIKCPCCYGDHLKDFDTVKQPSQLFLSILGQLVVICKACQKKVKLESHSTHSCGSDEEIGACTSATSEPVAVILSRGSDIPLTPVEEQLQSSLTRRSLSQSAQPLLRIKTGGQVGIRLHTAHVRIEVNFHIQPMTLVPVPSPRVGSERASQRTRHRQTASLQTIWDVISGGSSAAQFVDESRSRSASENGGYR